MLTMGKRTMKEWILLEPREPAECRKDLPLFREAMAYAFAECWNIKKKKR